MSQFGSRWIATLTPGVRVMLSALTLVYLGALIGKGTGTWDLNRWLAVNAADFWHGQLWRVISYAPLPAGPMDFLMNAVALIMLGSQLERHWSRGELWRFSLIAAAGAGLAQVLLSSLPLTGAAPMVFGLLVAWAFLSGHAVLPFPIVGEMSVRKMVLILATVSFSVMFFSAGWVRAAVMGSGGVTGWIYLWLQNKWRQARPAHTVESRRINRLEL